MPTGGIECSTCKRVRAPALAECPWCRASTPPPKDDLGEIAPPTLLDAEDDTRSMTSLPSRIVLVMAPLLVGVSMMELMHGAHGAMVPHSYASGGLVVALLGLLVSAVVAVLVGVAIDRLGRRVRIEGQAPHRLAIAIMALVGVLPAVWMPVDRWLDELNTGTGAERVPVPCTWSEAHQIRDANTGALIRVSVDATCATPSGPAELDLALDPASGAGAGGQLTIFMWPGRISGWLYTHDRVF